MYVLTMFLFVFSPTIVNVPLNTGKLVVLVLMFRQLALVAVRPGLFTIRREVWIHALLIGVMFAVSTAFFAAEGGLDFLLPYSYLINIVENLVGALLLVFVFRDFGYSINQCFKVILIAFIAQSIIMIASLLLAPVRDFFFSLNANGAVMRGIYDRYHGIRGVGFSSGVTFDLSSAYLIAVLLLCYMYAQGSIKGVSFVGIFGFLVLGVVISGRTGLIGLVFVVPMLLYLAIASKAAVKRMVYLKIVLFCAGATVAFLGLLEMVLPEKFNLMMDFAFEMFSSANDGSLHTDSTDVLFSMLSKRISYETLIFGDGRWVDEFNPNVYYQQVDVGYFRHIFYYGIFATALSLSIFVGIPFLYSRRLRESGLYLHTCFLVAFFLFVEVKGDFIWGSAMNMKLLNLILLSSLYLRRYNHADGWQSIRQQVRQPNVR